MYTNDSSHFEKHHTTTTNRINTHFFSPHEAPQMCDIYATVIQLTQSCHNLDTILMVLGLWPDPESPRVDITNIIKSGRVSCSLYLCP